MLKAISSAALAFALAVWPALADPLANGVPPGNSAVTGSSLDPATNCVVCSVNGKTGAVTTATLAGSYTVSQLSTTLLPANNTQRYAFVTDLGGGPAYLFSNGTCWKRQTGEVSSTSLTATTNLTVSNLAQSNIIGLTAGTGLLNTISLTVANPCDGDTFLVDIPSGILSTVSNTLNVQASTSSGVGSVLSLSSLTGGNWYRFQYHQTGNTMTKIEGGPL